jgi:hypothetical protein
LAVLLLVDVVALPVVIGAATAYLGLVVALVVAGLTWLGAWAGRRLRARASSRENG